MPATEPLYYKIGEACRVLDIQPYVLRYWETEFPHLSPDKSKSGQRVYLEKDLQIIRRIKELLYDEGFTIAGAKKKLDVEVKNNSLPAAHQPKSAKSASFKKKAKTAKVASGPRAVKKRAPKPVISRPRPAVRLDTSQSDEIKRLQRGMRKALKEAEGLLEALESRTTSTSS